MWFKHRAWIPIAWLLSAGNVVATWFAAAPAEPLHATTHALFAVLFGLGAERLAARKRALSNRGGELPAAPAQIDAETLLRLERGVDAMAIELERIGEGQRFITKVLTDSPRRLERSSPSSAEDR